MTEREAWLVLAEACENHVADFDTHHQYRHFYVCGKWCDGLCQGIYRISVTPDVRSAMQHKLYIYGPKTHAMGYKWPRTAEGMLARAEFCRSMAELCAQEVAA